MKLTSDEYGTLMQALETRLEYAEDRRDTARGNGDYGSVQWWDAQLNKTLTLILKIRAENEASKGAIDIETGGLDLEDLNQDSGSSGRPLGPPKVEDPWLKAWDQWGRECTLPLHNLKDANDYGRCSQCAFEGPNFSTHHCEDYED